MPNIVEIIESPSDALFARAVGLLQRFFLEEDFGTPPDLIETRAAAMAASDRHWLAGGLVEGQPAGVATASLFFTIEAGDFTELADLYVLPSFRGRGLARCLIEAAAAWSASHGAHTLEVAVTPIGARRHGLDRFYRKHGFEDTGRTIFVRDAG